MGVVWNDPGDWCNIECVWDECDVERHEKILHISLDANQFPDKNMLCMIQSNGSFQSRGIYIMIVKELLEFLFLSLKF